MLSSEDLAYMAGIIDGEGYIGIIRWKQPSNGHTRYDLRLVVTMCNPLIPSWLHAKFGGCYYEFQPPSLKRKKLYAWRLSAQPAAEFLGLILPYLKMKQGEAKIAIEFKNCWKNKKTQRKPDVIIEAEGILHRKLKELHERQYSGWKLGA